MKERHGENMTARDAAEEENRDESTLTCCCSVCGSSSSLTDKTANKWEDRADFSAKSGKYTLLEMDNSADEEEEARLADRLNAFNSGAAGATAAAAGGDRSASPAPTKFKPSVLKPEIQSLMALLFDTGMFQQVRQKRPRSSRFLRPLAPRRDSLLMAAVVVAVVVCCACL